MTWELDRRSLVLGGTLGFGALMLTDIAAIGAVLSAKGFTHGVASGEPGPVSILLWTRYVAGNGNDTPLAAEISLRSDFSTIISGGTAIAEHERDFTARVVITGLIPDRWYYYRFIAPDGSYSPIGRTRTLPIGPTARFTLGVFSCSNLAYGWFNAYGHAAARRDLDVIVHLGDYIYEHKRGTYPSAKVAVRESFVEPENELLSLADYRLRYACYRKDPDLQKLHRAFPMIAQWDDHEVANDAWENGAENHHSNEGDYQVRKAAAMRAYRDWMPVSGDLWSSYDIGDLATIFRPETRLTARSKPLSLAPILQAPGEMRAKLLAFRDGPLADPDRTLMGQVQEKWLYDGLKQSVKRGAKWQIVAQQVNVGQIVAPHNTFSMVGDDASQDIIKQVRASVIAAQIGLPFDFDGWTGFPKARTRLLRAAQSADADLVLLSGDSHNSWAFNHHEDGKVAGVEFGGPSVTSPGIEAYLKRVGPSNVARALRAANPALIWADTAQRGYMAITLTPERVTGDWIFTSSIKSPDYRIANTYSMTVKRGRRKFVRFW